MMAPTTSSFDDDWTYIERDSTGFCQCKSVPIEILEERKQQQQQVQVQVHRSGKWTEVTGKRAIVKKQKQGGAPAIPNSGSLYSVLVRRNRVRKDDLFDDDDYYIVPDFTRCSEFA